MRIKITIEPINREGIILPRHYNYLIQGFIYKSLKKQIATKVHDQGFLYEKRAFRLFTFSRLFGTFENADNSIIYKKNCILYVASPLTKILESFANSLAKKGKIKIGNNYLQVCAIEVLFAKEYNSLIYVRTLSPITVYSTLLTKDGQKKTYYYTPFEDEFGRQIRDNLLKKYAIININNKECVNLDFNILPHIVSKKNEHIIFYKDTVIKAWSGIYKMEGSKELLNIAFDCGIGAKNSQGFGMIEEYSLY
ncbi:MAG: CRISPR-associated endoribonuclease Cas6 [candidate division WOR-3 bacterium]